MFTQGSVTITKVINGWIVYMPEKNPVQYDPDDYLRHQARIMKDEIQGDPLLKQLQSEEKPTGKEKQLDQIPVLPGVHIFESTAEMIAFLTEKFRII